MSDESVAARDPEELRRWGYQIVDRFVQACAEETQDPVLANVTTEEMVERFGAPLPKSGASGDAVIAEMLQLLDGTTRKNGHPGFLAYVCASADPLAVLAEFWTAALNQNVTAWRSAPGATSLELQVVRWLSELVGFGGEHGFLTSGGSMANATAAASSLTAVSRKHGVEVAELLPRIRVYLSSEAHLSLSKAFVLCGVPRVNIREVAVNAERELDVAMLREMIRADVDAGFVPACVCGTAGTVNTGAVDPLFELAAISEEVGAWFHIDGAYGGPVAATSQYAHLRSAFARANSLSIDPHKWLFCPLDVGCVLVRDKAITEATYRFDSAYTTDGEDPGLEGFAFFEHGLEMSRRARAIKVWTVLSVFGSDGIAREIARQIALRERFDARVAREERLEGLGSGLSISCFRFRAQDPESSTQLNRAILGRLNQGGGFYLSPTTLEGRYALRICIVNLQTMNEHLDKLLDDVLRFGAELEEVNA